MQGSYVGNNSLNEHDCNELDNCIGIPKLDIVLASPKFPVPLWTKNQIRDPSCLFSPSNSVNANSFVKTDWFCTMQFPKDVFWVKLITSHNKICFNPINVRWLCLDPMCVCFLCALHVCAPLILFALSSVFTSCQQIWHWGEWLLKTQFVYMYKQ